MKCRGIIFSGIMGTLLASFSAQAATTQIASKQYVDKKEAAILESVSNTYETKENVTNLTEQVTNLGDTINNPETGLAGKVDDAVKDAAEAKAGLELKEDKANKATSIDDGNKGSADAYPSVGAIVQWTDKRLSELSTEGIPVNPEDIPDGSITEGKLESGLVSKIDGKADKTYVDDELAKKEDKANIVQTIRSSVEAEETKYTSEKAVATALEGKADSSALTGLATKEELEGLATKDELGNLATKDELAGYATTGSLDAKEDKSNKIQSITEESTGDQYPSAVAVRDALAGKANTGDLANLATKDELGAKADKTELDAYAKTESLKPVAFSGSYNDLENKPVIPEGAVVDTELTPEGTNAVQGKVIYEALQGKQPVGDYATKGELAGYATTGSLDAKEDKSNKTATLAESAELASDEKYPSEKAVVSALAGKQEKGDYATKTELDAYAKTEDLATVAKTGSYNDLADKPTIPEGVVVDETLTPEGTNAVQGKAIYEALQGKQEKGDYATKTELAGKANVSDSLSGYGITDAYTKTETDTKLLDKADKAALDEKENTSNKVIAISEGNQSSVTEYPSVAAIVQWTDKKLSDLSTEGIPVNPGNIPSGAITEDKLDSGLIAKIDGKEDKTNKVSVIDDSNKTDATKYASVKAVADYVIPKPGENCTAESGLCVLSATSDGSIAWVNVTAPAN